jgi:histone-lysine N-methyltransferase SETD2
MVKTIVEKEVPKVVQAIRQTQSRKVLMNLLTRVKVRRFVSPTPSIPLSNRRFSFVVFAVLAVDYGGSSCATANHASSRI